MASASSRLVVVVAVLGLAAGCSDDSSSGSPAPAATSVSVVDGADATTIPVINPPPRVDLIAEAVAALEAEMGGAQQYFEINATPRLVNLFVALNDGAVAQSWVYFDGQLTSQEGQPAQGNTFSSAALDFDADTVLDGVVGELPTSVFDAFTVEGGAGGIVRYSVIVTSSAGGQLVVIVGPDGAVISVDPV